MRDQRNFANRLIGLCFSFFVGCLLLYLGVQLLQAIFGWIVVSAIVVVVALAVSALLRWRRERW